VHLGHITVAQTALDALALDEVLFIPSCKPPHKVELTIAPFADRLAMLKLALEDRPEFSISDLEGERLNFSYTIDTLRELRQRLGEEMALFFLMGFDAFVEMASWKSYLDIPMLADLVVVNRPQAQQGSMAAAVHDVFGVQGGVSQQKQGLWQLVGGGQIHELVMAEVPVSSTAIREAFATGHDVSAMLHPQVVSYVRDRCLYQDFSS
jgi:nicotinate-nucleotide adenylyltransferase